MPQATPSAPPAATAACMSPLHSMERPPELAHCAKYGGTEKGLNVDYSRAVTCAFFTNLARWKISYENRLVQISRDSRETIV